MKSELAAYFNEAAAATGLSCSIYEDYSGRGMCGMPTTAVYAGSVGDLLDLLFAAGALAAADLYPNLTPSFRLDNLGKGYVIY